MSSNLNSSDLFERAVKVLPGGVNSPVRACKNVGCNPLFIQKADGAYIYDVEGRKYIDYIGSWGPMILGHNFKPVRTAVLESISNSLSFGAPCEKEVLVAELMTQMVPNVEMVRMVNSGTEAVMSAIRVARGVTGRNKIIKFAGCYHGHCDSMLVKAGSGALTGGNPDSKGVTQGTAYDTLTAEYNNTESVEKLLQANKNEVAAIIVEPVAANMGVVLPENNFLQNLRKLCDAYNTLLIFDEVITGFRLAKGGSQEYFGVKADLVTYGKIIGGGMPVGAYGGSREFMEQVAPCGSIYQAGTLSGNPVAMSAGLAQLEYLSSHPEVYSYVNDYGNKLAESFREIIKNKHLKIQVNNIGSLLTVFFSDEHIGGYDAVCRCNKQAFAQYYRNMLKNKMYVAPSPFEAMFISYAHTENDLNATLEAFERSV